MFEMRRAGFLVVLIGAMALAGPARAEERIDPRCAQHGAGFVYSETSGFCIKLWGSVQGDYRFGKSGGPFVNQSGGNGFGTEVEGAVDARKDTELGPLRLYFRPKARVE